MAVNAPTSPLPGATAHRSGSYLKISSGPSLSSQWHIKTRVTPADQVLAAACGLSPVTAAILRARGYTSAEAVKRFLNPATDSVHDPQQLPDIGLAVERLHRAITSCEPMLVFGDYDVDGVTSTALLLRSLQRLKANVSATIPERSDGYGLSIAAVEAAAAKGFTLILTADCGIRAHEPIARARELGIDVIVTDHHEPGETLPPAVAVVNPKRHDSVYGFRELCGCAVAFKVLQALLETHWPRAVDSFYEKYVELVALATIADCMPLVDENRILTREGLDRLGSTNKAGLRALMKIARIEPGKASVSGRQVGFGLAPRINSAGRFNVAHKSLDLMLATDAGTSERLAAELEDHNKQRQATT